MERIEPIRRDEPARGVTAVTPVAPRERERRREENPRERRRRETPDSRTVVTPDDDGTPHVDVRA